MSPLPMFPLGTVLLPGTAMPLRVFEMRYRALMHDCLQMEEPGFGIVLIERGYEVGGGDVRTNVGCLGRIARAAQSPDGQWRVIVVGTDRLRVREWLRDDPYPRAEVEVWEDEPSTLDPDALQERHEANIALVRRVLAMAAELGEPAGDVLLDFADDPVLGTWQIAAVAPLGALDRHRVLCAPEAGARALLLGELLADEAELLTLRLRG